MLPINSDAVTLPVIIKPVLVIVNTLAVPPTPAIIFPLDNGIIKLLVPLLIPLVPLPGGVQYIVPLPSVVSAYPDPPPPIVILVTGPKLLKPVIFKLGIVTNCVVLSNVKFALPSNSELLLY